MKKIGFFGGTFDPIHFGHINLALELMEKGGLDEVVFCPAFCSPFKTDVPPIASAEERYLMVVEALEDVPNCRAISIEVEQKRTSYTIDTLKKLQQPGVQYRLILSEDMIASFHRWKNPDELLRLAPPLVGSRVGAPQMSGPYADIFKKGTFKTAIFEISSTQIRQRLSKKIYCGHLVPKKALDHIARHGLYSL